MNIFRNAVLVGTLAVALGVAADAHANLIISVNGTTETTSATNNYLLWSGSVGAFNINTIQIAGVDSFGGSGELMDVGSLNISTTGSGSLQIVVTETNLTLGSGNFAFNLDFSGSLSNITATRSIYLDTSNGGAQTTLLGTTTSGNFSTTSLQGLTGPFSLTEVIDLTATGTGAKLSSDDSVKVPEPGSLALLGAGLVAFGWFTRRRRKTA